MTPQPAPPTPIAYYVVMPHDQAAVFLDKARAEQFASEHHGVVVVLTPSRG